jgi:hypothetical protein
LYCSDFTSRDFVVKGAEDLRIDSRIQQLFDVMNGMVSQHPACSIRGLHLPTFPVVPVTPSCGLLGFVPNTRPLQVTQQCGVAEKLPQCELTDLSTMVESTVLLMPFPQKCELTYLSTMVESTVLLMPFPQNHYVLAVSL